MTERPDPASADLEDDPELPPPERGRRRLSFDRVFNSFVPILGLAACCFFLAQARRDLLYVAEGGTPVDLGGPGAYHFELARPGLYCRISGTVVGDGAHYQNGFSAGKVWPLTEAPVLIQRLDFAPRHGKIVSEGMLQDENQLDPKYHGIIKKLESGGVMGLPGPDVATPHAWVLMEGHTPHGLDAINLYVLVLVALAALNFWWVIRPLLRR